MGIGGPRFLLRITESAGTRGVMMGCDFRMKRKAKVGRDRPRGGNLLLALGVAVVVLLLLLRMILFVAGHGHHRL
jgi:hypothetical protein